MRLVVDPVCGMEFEQEAASASSNYQGSVYYFCHPVCKKIFDADSTRFLQAEAAEATDAQTPSWDEDENRKNLRPDCEWASSAGLPKG